MKQQNGLNNQNRMLTIIVFNNDSDSEFSHMIEHEGVEYIVVNGQDRCSAYNSVLEKVNDEYVWFVDNSISITKKELERIVDRLSVSETDYIAFDYIVCYGDGSHDVCHSNLYYSRPSQIVTMYSREKHVLFLPSMIFRMSIIRNNSLSFCDSAGMYAQKLFVIEYLHMVEKVDCVKDVVASFCFNVDKEYYCRKPEYTKQRLEQYKVFFDRLKCILEPQDVSFLEDDCFLFKDECSIYGVLPRLRFNSMIPLPYAAIKRNAWSYKSLLKLTVVYVLNKII